MDDRTRNRPQIATSTNTKSTMNSSTLTYYTRQPKARYWQSQADQCAAHGQSASANHNATANQADRYEDVTTQKYGACKT